MEELTCQCLFLVETQFTAVARGGGFGSFKVVEPSGKVLTIHCPLISFMYKEVQSHAIPANCSFFFFCKFI